MANKFSDNLKSTLATTRGRVIFIIVSVIILGGIIIGAILVYDSYKYFGTDNAYISAALIPVSSLSASQVISLDVNYSDYVEKGQKVATVGMPRSSGVADMLGRNDVPMGRANVESPVDGYIAAIWQYPGALVGAGSPIVTVYDISNTWVVANIAEGQIHRIAPDQNVEITVDVLGGTKLKGKVIGIAAATAATFSLLPQNNTTGNFVKVAQVIPVKIAIENPDNYMLVPGSSVEVKIEVK